jgi:hypothetical protein
MALMLAAREPGPLESFHTVEWAKPARPRLGKDPNSSYVGKRKPLDRPHQPEPTSQQLRETPRHRSMRPVSKHLGTNMARRLRSRQQAWRMTVRASHCPCAGPLAVRDERDVSLGVSDRGPVGHATDRA